MFDSSSIKLKPGLVVISLAKSAVGVGVLKSSSSELVLAGVLDRVEFDPPLVVGVLLKSASLELVLVGAGFDLPVVVGMAVLVVGVVVLVVGVAILVVGEAILAGALGVGFDPPAVVGVAVLVMGVAVLAGALVGVGFNPSAVVGMAGSVSLELKVFAGGSSPPVPPLDDLELVSPELSTVSASPPISRPGGVSLQSHEGRVGGGSSRLSSRFSGIIYDKSSRMFPFGLAMEITVIYVILYT